MDAKLTVARSSVGVILSECNVALASELLVFVITCADELGCDMKNI